MYVPTSFVSCFTGNFGYLIYEIYFLKYNLGGSLAPEGKVLLVYRNRGSDENHEALWYDKLPSLGWTHRPAKNTENIGKCNFVLMERSLQTS